MGIQRGPYGAAAGHQLELTLDKIKQHPHGLDIGPLAPSLPERLCTSDGKITLVADYILKTSSALALIRPRQKPMSCCLLVVAIFVAITLGCTTLIAW